MKNFVLGLILGLIIGFGVAYLLINRYEFRTSDNGLIIYKTNKFSGEAWRAHYGKDFEKIK
jgi:hypothetical protein